MKLRIAVLLALTTALVCPGAAMADDLRRRGVSLVAHPLETIDQAALVTGQRFARWKSALRAA